MLGTRAPDSLVVMFDVDNTLLDNDRFAADLDAWLVAAFGAAQCARYWAIYAALRDECGYADYLGAVQRFRTALGDDPALMQLSAFLLDYPFAKLLYPGALAVVEHVRTLAWAVIVSDGDAIFQPRKIQRSGLWDAMRGDVLICLHKQYASAAIRRRYPAARHAMVDDKRPLLAQMKQQFGASLATVFVRQGHYAAEPAAAAAPAADLEIDHIGELCGFARDTFLAAPKARAAASTAEPI